MAMGYRLNLEGILCKPSYFVWDVIDGEK